MAAIGLKSDAQIQLQVLDELRWDTRVDAAGIGVAVDGGVVALTGQVDSYAARLAAQEAAHRVAGVLDVANDIRVELPGSHVRSDTDIAHAVRTTLLWDIVVPEERIRTTVTDGWVTLEGTAATWNQREDAERAIRHVTGVRGVTNMIALTGPAADSTTVQRALEDALVRRAEREADRIRVRVHDGTVTLSGYVRTYAEKRAVLGAAGHAPGVLDIVDQIRIEPLV